MTVFVAVLGAAPGVGKSTLCVGLARALTADGWSVDHFREEEILSRSAYAAVAAEFRATGVVRPETLLTATTQYVNDTTADVVVADALFPYLGRDPCAGRPAPGASTTRTTTSNHDPADGK